MRTTISGPRTCPKLVLACRQPCLFVSLCLCFVACGLNAGEPPQAFSVTLDLPSLHFDGKTPRRQVDIGTIIKGQQYEVRIPIKNSSSRNLIVRDIKSSCGCILPKSDGSDSVTLKSGETHAFEMRLVKVDVGRFAVQATVVFKTGQTLSLSVLGKVVDAFAFYPPSILIDRSQPDNEFEIRLSANGKDKFGAGVELELRSTTGPVSRCSIDKLSRSAAKVDLFLSSGKLDFESKGRISFLLTPATNSDPVEVFLPYEVKDSVTIYPKMITARVAEKTTLTFHLRTHADDKLHVSEGDEVDLKVFSDKDESSLDVVCKVTDVVPVADDALRLTIALSRDAVLEKSGIVDAELALADDRRCRLKVSVP